MAWISPKPFLATARKVAPNGDFIQATGVKLPFKERCFKTAVLNDVLEHVPYPFAKPLLEEAKRILKQEGKLYISVSNTYQILEPHTLIPFLSWVPSFLGNALCRVYGKPQYIPWGHVIYPYTVSRLANLCRETRLSYVDYTWFYAWNKVSNIDQIGNPTLKALARAIRRLRLTRIAYHVAEKISVILFICNETA